jgi:tRNA (guanine-N7-)-methyltransferase
MPAEPRHPARGALFFGRRKGKPLRGHQAGLLAAVLPQLRLALGGPCAEDPAALFTPRVRAVHLEIGFGGGEHLARRAAEDSAVGFIGCEAFVNGVGKLMAAIERDDLHNIRLWDDDAQDVVDWLPAASIERVYVLYPDPWPKRRHRKRRFLSVDMLGRLARIMCSGAKLHFATDVDDYAAFVLARVARLPALAWTAERADDWRHPWPGWTSTRYEQKALREGRVPTYLTFSRR